MKNKILLLAITLLLPTVASAQLITSAQTITVKEKRQLLPVEPGYEQSAELSFSTCFNDDYGVNYVGVSYIGGYRFSRFFFLGAGIGINFNYCYNEWDWGNNYKDGCGEYYAVFDNLVSVPLFLHARLYFTDTMFQPFVAFSMGGQITGDREPEYHGEYGIDIRYNPSAFFVNPVVGLNIRTYACFDFYVSTGLTAACKVSRITYWNYGQSFDVHRNFDNGLGWNLNLGITF